MDCVRFQDGSHVGGGHTPLSAQVGEGGGGGGGGGAQPPGGSEQRATAEMDLTTPPQGSLRPAVVRLQKVFPKQAAEA